MLPTGILPIVQTFPRQYHLIQEPKTWTEAQAFCRLNFVDLATVENSTDMAMLLKEAHKHNFTSQAWVGLYNDVNSWRCSLNEIPLGSFQKWGTAQPNNLYGHEECAMMDQNGLWWDDICSKTKFCLCYDAKSTGISKFILISDAERTWQEAQAYCRQHYTDLACPRDEAENTDIMSNVLSVKPWIGLYRDSWKCRSSGSSSGSTDGWFDDDNCLVRRAFFCHSELTLKKTQIVRLMIQTNQNVNNPALKADILDKMQQTLKEQGMAESTTLRWREKPDGTVFHTIKMHNSDSMENSTI
ncbi:hypothetical protein MHYP_G00245840 [Metynnis hypsauchen]